MHQMLAFGNSNMGNDNVGENGNSGNTSCGRME